MPAQPARAGGRPRRLSPGVTALFLVVAGAGFAASALTPGPEVRPPKLRHAPTPGGPVELILDSVPPLEPVRMLYFQGRPVVPGADGRLVVVSETGTVFTADSAPRLRPLMLALGGSSALGAAPGDDGGWWVSTLDGELLRVDAAGVVTRRSRAPFAATALWADWSTHGIIATRSPERFAFLPESPESPVVAAVDSAGRPRGGRGKLLVPQHSLLATLANAGHAVGAGDTVFFAPLSRPDVVALNPMGDTIWVSGGAGLPPTPEPRFGLVKGRVQIDYQPLNLGMTLGPDGMLYVLRAADTAVTRARLDVLDRATGRVLWSARLPGPRATLAANRLGRVYAVDEDRLLGATPTVAREPLADFDLPRLGGGRTSLKEQRGRVLLVNIWASWCSPCRTEMPALDTLQRALSGDGFAFLAITDDESRPGAERFVAERRIDFPVLFGDGRMKERFHYPGLPYTMLTDREGRIVRKWIGELRPADYALIRTLVQAELARKRPDNGQGGPVAAHLHR
jgi:thiol-disulfide isomerase/thioredoxin